MFSEDIQRAEIQSDTVTGEIFFDGTKLSFRPQGTIESPRFNRDPSRGISLQSAASVDAIDEYKGLVDTKNFQDLFNDKETNLAVSGVLEAIRNDDKRVKYEIEEPKDGLMNLKVKYEIMPKIWRDFEFELSSPTASSKMNATGSFSLSAPPNRARRSRSVGSRRTVYNPLAAEQGKKPQKGRYKAVKKGNTPTLDEEPAEAKIAGGEPKGYSIGQKNALTKILKKLSPGAYVVRRSWDKKSKNFDPAIFVVTYKGEGKIRHHKVRYFDGEGYGAEKSGKGDSVSANRYKTIDEYVKGEVSEATTPLTDV